MSGPIRSPHAPRRCVPPIIAISSTTTLRSSFAPTGDDGARDVVDEADDAEAEDDHDDAPPRLAVREQSCSHWPPDERGADPGTSPATPVRTPKTTGWVTPTPNTPQSHTLPGRPR